MAAINFTGQPGEFFWLSSSSARRIERRGPVTGRLTEGDAAPMEVRGVGSAETHLDAPSADPPCAASMGD